MENGSFFKTATFGGFEKKDVLNYVDELHRKIFKLEGDVAKLIEDNENLIATKSQLVADTDNLKAELEAAKAAPVQETDQGVKTTLIERDQRLAQLTAKLEEQQNYAAARESQIIELNTRLAQSEEKFEQMSKRAAKYDEASIDVGAVLVDARRSADQIISQAQKQAQELTGESQQYVSQIESKLEQLKSAVEEINSSIEDNMRRQVIRNESIIELIESAASTVKIKKHDTAQDCEQSIKEEKQEEVASFEGFDTWKPENVDENIFK
ncbi:MAG TPA: hypothetical protein VJX95_01890 [Oscillospiraceae bacterium]|nr:hypothetical protein [Oscillospiraceae bacterium]